MNFFSWLYNLLRLLWEWKEAKQMKNKNKIFDLMKIIVDIVLIILLIKNLKNNNKEEVNE